MSEELIGRVISIYGRSLLRIAVLEEKLPLVSRIGTYVKVRDPNDDTWLYGLVIGFNLLDELYKHGRIVEEMEGYEELRPSRNEVLANIVGYTKSGRVFRGCSLLPRPGEKVYLVDKEELSLINGKGDIAIGVNSTFKDVEVRLDINKLCSRHLAILAMTGAGKSNALAIILAEILNKYRYSRIILIDTHSEYVSLAHNESFRAKVYMPKGSFADIVRESYGIDVKNLEIPLWTLGFEEIANILRLDSKATKQRLHLRDAIRSSRRKRFANAGVEDPIYYTIDDLISEVKGIRDSSALELLIKLRELKENEELFFLTKTEETDKIYTSVQDLKEPERSLNVYNNIVSKFLDPSLNIISLGGLPAEIQASIVSSLLRAVWRVVVSQRVAGLSFPVMIAIEEAHIYAPKGKWTPARDILERVAREGRKFGVSLTIVSQRPRELSETLLSQCGNLIALRTVNPEDQRHIMRSMEDVSYETVQNLSGLEVGEALISGPSITFPAIVKIYEFSKRYNLELGGKDIDWRAQWSTPPREITLRHSLHSKESEEKVEHSHSLDEFLMES